MDEQKLLELSRILADTVLFSFPNESFDEQYLIMCLKEAIENSYK